MKFRRFDNFIWITCLVIVVTLGWSSTSVAQKSTDTISTVVIDSAPKKLYSELYSENLRRTAGGRKPDPFSILQKWGNNWPQITSTCRCT